MKSPDDLNNVEIVEFVVNEVKFQTCSLELVEEMSVQSMLTALYIETIFTANGFQLVAYVNKN